jgi:predicted PurR-regulated permease PerM
MALVSLIHFDSVWYALLPPLAYVLCAMIEGNLATPLFLGRWLTLPVDFSSLVLPLGCGPALCSLFRS